ncbi:MAG: Asp23/Gls24 family envelope stress response protein [Clostridia bacterium]|nr:Asp23/Gls24 family envelope stress response protein [Clostridia bacterium]MBR4459016.1 Asp23/Gls24 family envelope stress response protein [Clostridia bacterium]
MASKKDTQLKTVEPEAEEASSTITYSSDVIATIAGMAVSDVEGVAGMANVTGTKIGGKNKAVTKGIKVEIGPEEVSCDLYVLIEYGRPIQKVATEVQENVRRSLETMTGLHVVRVDVHVQGISFERENSALTAGAQKAKLTSGAEKKPAE